MVKGLLSVFTKEVRGMHEAAYLLALFALLSQLLGLFRDRLLASHFGIGETLDIYYAAFRIPDFLFVTVASLFSLYAILPALARAEGKEARAVEGILLWFFALTSAAGAVAYALAPTLALHLAPGFDVAAREEMVSMTRILLLQPILLGASNVLASLTQLKSRFAIYAVSPLLYNLGIIGGIVFLYPLLGLDGLAWGVVVGALLHLLVQMPHFLSERHASSHVAIVQPPLRQILTLSVPRTAALAAGQLTLLVLIAMGSNLSSGTISAFSFSMNLGAVPLAIIGMSYSVAAFPTLARLFGRGERDNFLLQMTVAFRHILFWSVPAIVLIVVLRAQLVRVVLGGGLFDWDATRLTAAALAIFAIAIAAQSVTYLLARGYYAAGRTARPLMLACISVAVSVGLAEVFLTLFNSVPSIRYFLESLLRVEEVPGASMLMLVAGYVVGALIHAALGLWFFARDFDVSLGTLWPTFWRGLSSAIIGGFAAYLVLAALGLVVDIDTFVGIFAQGLAGGLAGLLITGVVLYLLRSPELKEALDAFARRFRDKPQVAVEPSDLSSQTTLQ